MRMQVFKNAFLASALALLCTACGTNPVTGKSEIQFLSTAQEIQIGQQNYVPARQVQGGDYIVDPELTRYVQQVNARLAAVSDRELPYEIEVLNSSVPNAWAMPGGKMAINRGLLLELGSEAELAAVLGHEIVHAAARHGAKSQERGMFLQGGMLAAQIAAANSQYGSLIAGGAAVGAQLAMTKYGRNAELESDRYGMEYMVRAGYNPLAAVDLQKTFVRLSEGRQTDWLSGLFASHPPSSERVAKNIETAEALGGTDLEFGRERYQRAIANLTRTKPAYDAHDKALEAAGNKDFTTAKSLINQAIQLQPKEPKFYGLRGDLALNEKDYRTAVNQYDRAINLYHEYFGFHLNRGYAQAELGNSSAARSSFEESNRILPTPNAQKALGDLALSGGNQQQAMQYYTSASQSNSAAGQAAQASLMRLELPSQPNKYIKTQLSLNSAGQIVVTVQNHSSVRVNNVQLVAAYFDANGNQVSRAQPLRLNGTLEPQTQRAIATRMTDGNGLRVQVSSAAIVE